MPSDSETLGFVVLESMASGECHRCAPTPLDSYPSRLLPLSAPTPLGFYPSGSPMPVWFPRADTECTFVLCEFCTLGHRPTVPTCLAVNELQWRRIEQDG